MSFDSTDINRVLEEGLGENTLTMTNEQLDELKETAKERAIEQMSNDRSSSFSKTMIIVTMAMTFVAVVAAIVLQVIFGQDVSGILQMLIPVCGADSVFAGFYFWKEKNANRAKYAQQFVLIFADKYGIESAIQIAEIVLKE